ncbi:directed RNA polymerase (II) subunit 1 [Moumouvirus australiensis]|uniref:directed RNA polymerase (II) subunit 1 n=1 Tax=Moumouvirus australiensis TaxID=2109587 RepID=UPI0022061737|nr:directed RNA polymerase (II) subunit 1 [Moumouvirus australiensis]AVL94696.2 directed RNA polymerase (II) subunit 1 [Moumouvirus australiensis]
METNKNTYSRIVDTEESITAVEFRIYSNSDVAKYSAISDPNGITVAEIQNNNEPVQGGVIDRRLGVTESRIECATCGETALKCPGHFGHIKFVEPVFHTGFLPFLKNILSCICIRCNKLLVHRNEAAIDRLLRNKHGKQRFAEIRSICKGITHCQKDGYGCGTPVHKISIEKRNCSIYLLAEPVKRNDEYDQGELKKRSPQILSPQLCYDILKSVSNEDCIVMGFDPEKSRPEDMIIVNFPVPPVQVRPSIKMEILSSSTVDDDLTHKLVDIIKNNENLKNSKGDGSLVKYNVNDDFMLLQYHVATFFANDGSLAKCQQKNKKLTKDLSSRLRGKEGRIRGNLMGKRVDMSGRTVITSDPNIALNEVGLPLIIAKNLTFDEIVTEHNIEYLTQLVKNGRRVYPGANFVIKSIIDNHGNEAKHIYHLKYVEKPIALKPGDIVKRHLVNGDIILFNRQPSLHKLSMMGHKCHIINNPDLLTFRVNVSVTDPYNADWEMNIHIPETIQTVSELLLIANAAKRFVSPATSKIAINAKQDTLMGSYVQTNPTMEIDTREAMSILMATSVKLNNTLPKIGNVSGKELYSQIIPKGINIIRRKDNGEYQLRIRNGQLLDGRLGKPEIGSILQKIWLQYGSKETQTFIDDCQRMILQFLMRYGYTVSIKDMIVTPDVNKYVYEIIETKRKETLKAITEYENDPYIMTKDAFEITLQENLKSLSNEIRKAVMNNFNHENGLFIAISSGSSGTDMNAGQIAGCIGQVIVEDKRIQKRFNGRTLPMFAQHDDSALPRGFCPSSFIKGLGPAEFFFQVMAGREGIINTAIKTADTGYVQRKLVKMLEDIKVEYDGTVRNANDKLIQCVYGDNGINTENQVEQKIYLISANNSKVRNDYVYSSSELATIAKSGNIDKRYTPDLNEKLYRKLVSMRDHLRRIQRLTNISSAAFEETYKLPVDIQQFIINIVNRENRSNNVIVDPYYVLKRIKDMYSGSYSKIMKYREDKSIIKKQDEARIKFLLKVYLYDVLAPKKCTHVHKLSEDEFDEIVEYFGKTIRLAKVEGGEMVGFVGAQSIGEPVTQTNLKSFHKSGTGKTVSGGLVRVKELLSISKNIKTPVMYIVFDDKYRNDKLIVNRIASYLKYTTIRDVVQKADIYYDPDPNSENSIMVRDGVDDIFGDSQGKSGCQTDITGLPWILRIVLSKEKMIERNIEMREIKTSFCRNWINRFEDSKNSKKEYRKVIEKITQCAIVSNYDNSPEPIIHVRFDANNYNFNTLVQFQDMVVNTYRIKGIASITESNNIIEESYVDFDEEGNKINNKHFVVVTDGINLSEIAQINGINLDETICNDIVTIYETYGVEAARTAFIKEFTIAIESSGGFSNYQHIELLADAITHMGGLIAVNRHGANKLDTDPFSRASFEKTVEQLLAAAAFGETDHIRSVSARIMVGNLINGGTGCFDLLLDHVKIKNTLPSEKATSTNIIVKKKSAIDNLIRKKKSNS